MSARQTKVFDKIVDPLDLLRVIRQSAPSVRGGILRFIAIAEHGIGTNEPQPAFHVAAVGLQPGGKPLHHATNHFGALRLIHGIRGRDVTCCGAFCGDRRAGDAS